MKINHTITTSTSALGNQEAAASGTASRAKPTSSGSKSDRLQLSNIGAHLSALRSGSDQSSAVAELGAAVSSGRYHVDAQLVSHKLIEEHLAA